MTEPDERALVRGIIANPADFTARLVFADWLQENAEPLQTCPKCKGARCVRQPRGVAIECDRCDCTGTVSDGRAERAELIRVQCELARLPNLFHKSASLDGCPCGGCELLRRSEELLTDDRRREWARVPCPVCKGNPSRGLGFKCRACQNTGDAMMHAEYPGHDGTATATPHFHRGFVERVEVPALAWVLEQVAAKCKMCRGAGWCECPESGLDADCPQCHGTGTDSTRTEWRVTEWAKAVAGTHPVTEFVIGDREPRRHYYMQGEIGADWLLDADTPADEGSVIPQPIYDRIASDLMYMREKGFSRGQWEQSREAALSALAIAAADVVREAVLKMWAREQVGVSSTAP